MSLPLSCRQGDVFRPLWETAGEHLSLPRAAFMNQEINAPIQRGLFFLQHTGTYALGLCAHPKRSVSKMRSLLPRSGQAVLHTSYSFHRVVKMGRGNGSMRISKGSDQWIDNYVCSVGGGIKEGWEGQETRRSRRKVQGVCVYVKAEGSMDLRKVHKWRELQTSSALFLCCSQNADVLSQVKIS